MSAATDAITDKLGPLPVYAWGAIAGLVIAGGSFLLRRNRPAIESSPAGELGSSVSPAPAPASIPATSSAAGSFMAAGTYVPPSGNVPYSPDSPSSSSSPMAPTDNAEWVRMGATLVTARNTGLTSSSVYDALNLYTDGAELTDAQAAIVELAIRAVGVPPYTVPPIRIRTNTPPPATTAPTPSEPAPFTAPSWLGSARFVKGSGPAIYKITARGIEWIPSESAFFALGGRFGADANYLEIPDRSLAALPRVGTLPTVAEDPSLALR
jgi:hypothetical protein